MLHSGRAARGSCPCRVWSSVLNTKRRTRFLITVSVAVFWGVLILVGLYLGWSRVLASNAALVLLVGLLVIVTVALPLKCYSRRWLLPWLALQTVGNTFAIAGILAGMLRSYDIGNKLFEAAFGSWILGGIALFLASLRKRAGVR